MTFRTRYLIYILTVHAALVGLTFLVLRQNKLLFIASEVLIAVSIYVAMRIYRTFQQPADFIASGVEAIQDKEFTVKFVPTGNEEVDALIRVYNLMIDQLRQERTRQTEQQVFLDKLVEAAPIALLILDYDGRVSALNPKARQLLRLSDAAVLGKPLSTIDHPLLQQAATASADRAPADRSQTFRGSGADTYRVLRGQFIDRGFSRQFLFIEELTAELIETEKKAYGKVIRMMAHEVNNSIGAVNSILHVTETDLPDADLRRAVRVAIDRNNRLNQFTRRFADIVRLPAPNLAPTDMAELLRNVAQLMQAQADVRQITLRVIQPAEPVVWPADVAQMEQVLVNVVKNALEASGPGNTVEMTVNDHQLTVRNDGPAIPDDVAVQLFNPFYSTKPSGQGIGLTLSRDILHNHGFTFALRTEPDGWTVFRIRR